MEAAVDVSEERLNKMDTTLLEVNWDKLGYVVEQQDVPKEDTTVETIRTLEDRYGDRHLAVGHHWQPKKRWWVFEEVGCRLQMDDVPYHSCTAEGTQS
jgi:hypothetical protein